VRKSTADTTDDDNDDNDDDDGVVGNGGDRGAAVVEVVDVVENDQNNIMDKDDDDGSTTRSLSAASPFDSSHHAMTDTADWPSVDITAAAHSDWPVEVTQSDSAAPDWLCGDDDAADVSHNSMLFEDDAPHSMLSSEADSVDVVDERAAAADLGVGDDSSPTLMLAPTDTSEVSDRSSNSGSSSSSSSSSCSGSGSGSGSSSSSK